MAHIRNTRKYIPDLNDPNGMTYTNTDKAESSILAVIEASLHLITISLIQDGIVNIEVNRFLNTTHDNFLN